MSPRRRSSARPAESSRRAPPPADDRATLMRKYRQLLAKHHTLVRKLELRTDEHLSMYRLSAWALETSPSALALLRRSVVLLANASWHALAHSGPWQEVGSPRPATRRTLRQVGEALMHELEAAGQAGPLVRRYQEPKGARLLEVRAERVGEPRGRQGPQAVLVLAHDITEQVHAEQELAKAQAALAEQEHLRALGELASGIAHDLNNTLNAMKLRLELLQRSMASTASHSTHLDAMARIVSDAATRIHRLQDFSRQRAEPSGEQARLDEVIREAVEIALSDIQHRAIREGISLRVETKVPQLAPVNASPTDLRYLFINLLLNARDAMPRGGTIRVSGALMDGQAVITVEDEGTGIPEKHLRSIFRPFFTTKGKHGTGLGLSMAYGVMSRAGGSISAANRPQGGAVFTLRFPLAGQRPPAPEAAPAKRARKKQAPRR
jgi:signal transduction histidine kinase